MYRSASCRATKTGKGKKFFKVLDFFLFAFFLNLKFYDDLVFDLLLENPASFVAKGTGHVGLSFGKGVHGNIVMVKLNGSVVKVWIQTRRPQIQSFLLGLRTK